MVTEAWCPSCQKDVKLVPLELGQEPSIPYSLFPQRCHLCGREFTIDGYTLYDAEDGRRLGVDRAD